VNDISKANYYLLKAVKTLVEQVQNSKRLFIYDTQLHNLKARMLSLYLIDDNYNELYNLFEKIYDPLIEKKDALALAGCDPGLMTHLFTSEFIPNELKSKIYQLLGRIADVLLLQTDNIQVTKALNEIQDFRTLLMRTRLPSLDTTQSAMNPQTYMLLKKEDWPVYPDYIASPTGKIILGTKLEKDMLFIVFFFTQFSFNNPKEAKSICLLGLAGIDIQKKQARSLWQAEVPVNPIINQTILEITSEICFVSLPDLGIMEFPGSLKEGKAYFKYPNVRPGYGSIGSKINNYLNRQNLFQPIKTLTQENGLPSLFMTSIAKAEDKLWIAYGGYARESGLGLYDPKTEKWETTFCSSLKEKNPFSAGVPYEISSIIYKNDNKLIFKSSGNSLSGLWSMNIENKELKNITTLGGNLSEDYENFLWLKSSMHWYKIDPNLDNITLVMRASKKQLSKYPGTIERLLSFKEDLFLPESFLNSVVFGSSSLQSQSELDLEFGAIYHDKLWARLGKSQIIIAEKGKSFEDAQIIDNNILDGKPVLQFISTPYGLIGIGEGTVGLIETGK